MTHSYDAFDSQAKNLIMMSIIGVFLLIFSLLFLLRKIVVKPIITFRNASKIIGKGDLDTKIDIYSKDEIGQLSKSFNQMTEDLKKSRDKVQEYNLILENLLDQKDEFIGQLGHDLKNPLQPLVGLLPVIIEKEEDPKIKEKEETKITLIIPILINFSINLLFIRNEFLIFFKHHIFPTSFAIY